MSFRNAKISVKILIPVALMGILIILLGVVSMRGTSSIMSVGEEITDNYAVSIEQIGDISTSYQSLRRVAFAHIVAQEEEVSRSLEEEAESLKAGISSLCKEFEKTLDPGEETESFKAFESNYEDYIEVYDKILDYSANGEDEKATEIANTDLRELGSKLTIELNDMEEANRKALEDGAKEQKAVYNQSRTVIFIVIVLGVLALMAVIYISWTWVCRRLININAQLHEVINTIEAGEGDLTKRVQCFSTDEIGTLANGINIFIETLQGIMGQINASSTKLGSIVGIVSGKVNTANSNSVDISAVMEELSASMEEIASTVAGIRENISVVETEVVELANASQGLYDYAGEMRERAENLEQNAVDNKNGTDEVIGNIMERLQEAMEHSKSVDQVNSLTDEILSISAQTNLLSLNASIEAARAGEAGRGFAVVADEISQLSNSSREAASNIQEINNMVVHAVNELIDTSKDMAKYISENVMPDYDGFVKAGKQYNDDAVHVNDIVTGFHEMSARLKELMESIMVAVDGINAAVDESAQGVTTAAMNTSDLVKDIGEIESAMTDNKAVAGDLTDEAKRFVNL